MEQKETATAKEKLFCVAVAKRKRPDHSGLYATTEYFRGQSVDNQVLFYTVLEVTSFPPFVLLPDYWTVNALL
jgi:hypothetical protein